MATQLSVGDVSVDVVFRDIKNVHLSVHPPTGRVRISAPSRMSPDNLRSFAISQLDWIRRQQARLQGQDREPPREYLDRESHYVWGKRYLLTVIEVDETASVEVAHDRLLLRVRPGTDLEKKQAVIDAWYRAALRRAIPPLVARWEPIVGAKVNQFFVQRMKTKWGSCNPRARTIRLNTELAIKPREHLEYVVLHEMVHLLEPNHDSRFVALMDQFMPAWQVHRQQLNRLPLRHGTWGC